MLIVQGRQRLSSGQAGGSAPGEDCKFPCLQSSETGGHQHPALASSIAETPGSLQISTMQVYTAEAVSTEITAECIGWPGKIYQWTEGSRSWDETNLCGWRTPGFGGRKEI